MTSYAARPQASGLKRQASAFRGWPGLVLLPAAALLFTPAAWPRWAAMWTLAFAIYAGCKWLTWRRTPTPTAPLWLHLSYLLFWPGMDAVAFLRSGPASVKTPTGGEWLFALGKFATGCVVLFGVARWIPPQWPYVVGWAGMIGIIMILHFGGFHLLSCAWRAAGINAQPLMNWPLLATSVSDYWGRRWNVAFRDLTHRFLFRPLTPRLGAAWAIGIVFVFSGLVHDLVVSVPAGAGEGGPTLFFVIQVLAIYFERSRRGRRWKLGRGLRGWLFAAAVLLLPACLLFHPPFVIGVVVSFMRAIGAI